MSPNDTTSNMTTLAAAPPYADTGNNGFVIVSAALVFIMTPGVGYFYSGMARSKNALSLIFVCFLAKAIVLLQWTLFGFSLTYSDRGGKFIGNFEHGGLSHVGYDNNPVAPGIHSITFMIYQAMFATLTPALIFGSVAERLRLLPAMLFIFLWTTFVYDFIACWTWSKHGWLRNLGKSGIYDFAGGIPVHISSGFAGLAMAMVLGKRDQFDTHFNQWKPHSQVSVFLGTALLWFGWLASNGASAYAGSARAAMSAFVTTIAAAAGGLTWIIFDYPKEKKLSALGFCCGAVSALVAITSASGFVAPWASIIIGISAGIVCNIACKIKHRLGYDDALDVFGVHGIGGFLGNILTGVFAQKRIAGLGGPDFNGGWVDGYWLQVPIQLAGSCSGAAWSFVLTYGIVFAMQKVPGLQLRLPVEQERLGVDLSQMGEMAYEFQGVIRSPIMQPRVANVTSPSRPACDSAQTELVENGHTLRE